MRMRTTFFQRRWSRASHQGAPLQHFCVAFDRAIGRTCSGQTPNPNGGLQPFSRIAVKGFAVCVGILFTTGLLTGAANTPLEAFKEHLGRVPAAFEIEFEEGDLESTAPSRFERLKSKDRTVWVVRQPRRQFRVKCEANGFWFESGHARGSDKGREGSAHGQRCQTLRLLRRSCLGQPRHEQRDADARWNGARKPNQYLASDSTSGAARLAGVLSGLPLLKPSSIRWEDAHLRAQLADGSSVAANLVVEEQSKRVQELRCQLRDATRGSRLAPRFL